MKKLFLFAAIAVMGIATVNAQGGFKVGANMALPVGDAGDISTFSIGLDAAYLFEVSEKFAVGGATGFTNAFGDTFRVLGTDIDYDDVQFIPVAAAARFYPADKFYVGADLGYAIGINDGNDGGFYYRPRVGYNFNERIGVNASYTGISRGEETINGIVVTSGSTWSTIGVGVEFSF